MSSDDVGYRKPPKNTRFKAGVSGNPKGRPKRSPVALAEIVGKVLNAPIEYRDQGRIKTASRLEVSLKLLVDRAVKGSIHDAGRILAARAHAQQFGDVGMEQLIITANPVEATPASVTLSSIMMSLPSPMANERFLRAEPSWNTLSTVNRRKYL